MGRIRGWAECAALENSLFRNPAVVDPTELAINIPYEGGRDARPGLGLWVKDPARRLAVELVPLGHLARLCGRELLIRWPPKEHVPVRNGKIYYYVAIFVLVAACYVALES